MNMISANVNDDIHNQKNIRASTRSNTAVCLYNRSESTSNSGSNAIDTELRLIFPDYL